MDTADVGGEAAVGNGAGAVRPAAPCVVAAGADLQHSAQNPDRKGRPMVLDEAEPHRGGTEKMPMAFFLGRQSRLA